MFCANLWPKAGRKPLKGAQMRRGQGSGAAHVAFSSLPMLTNLPNFAAKLVGQGKGRMLFGIAAFAALVWPRLCAAVGFAGAALATVCEGSDASCQNLLILSAILGCGAAVFCGQTMTLDADAARHL